VILLVCIYFHHAYTSNTISVGLDDPSVKAFGCSNPHDLLVPVPVPCLACGYQGTSASCIYTSKAMPGTEKIHQETYIGGRWSFGSEYGSDTLRRRELPGYELDLEESDEKGDTDDELLEQSFLVFALSHEQDFVPHERYALFETGG
jgi:hypothetical protein